MPSASHSPRRFASLNWEHIHMTVTIMLQYWLKVKRLNSIKHFTPTWSTELLFAEKINSLMSSLRYSMQVKMYSIQIRMQTLPKHGISDSNQASSLNWLLKFPHLINPEIHLQVAVLQ